MARPLTEEEGSRSEPQEANLMEGKRSQTSISYLISTSVDSSQFCLTRMATRFPGPHSSCAWLSLGFPAPGEAFSVAMLSPLLRMLQGSSGASSSS